jgi:predicted SAM-dependent methyltransferase
MSRFFQKDYRYLLDRKGPVKLNVGCGTDYKKGWINIDNNSDENIEKLDLNWDLRKPLPFPDNSVDFIFNEHFIEHLTVEEGQRVIKDLMRVLKPGGVLRMATPDLEIVAKQYLKSSLKGDPLIERWHLGIQTKAESINMSFRFWGHKWLYDYEELSRRVMEAGYKKIKRAKLRNSSYEELNNLEIREESLLIVEITK